MDVMQGRQAGYANMVAQMGTALTEAQLRQLKRYTTCLVLALDADAAGEKATLRGLDIARHALDREVEVVFNPRGLVRHESRLQADIRIATLPPGYDPDKLIRSDQPAWATLIETARPLVEYIIDAIVAEADPRDAKAKSSAVTRAMPVIQDVSNPIERDHYTQHLARQLGIDERTVIAIVAGAAQRGGRRTQTRTPPPPPPDAEGQVTVTPSPAPTPQPSPFSQEVYCLKHLLVAPAAWQQANNILLELGMYPISLQDFSDAQNRAIFLTIHELESPDRLPATLDEALLPRWRLVEELQPPNPDLPSERIAGHLAHTVLMIRKKANRRSKQELNSVWAEALSRRDEAAVGEYQQRVLELETLRLRIDRALGLIASPLTGHHDRTG
jgi:DNA primase